MNKSELLICVSRKSTQKGKKTSEMLGMSRRPCYFSHRLSTMHNLYLCVVREEVRNKSQKRHVTKHNLTYLIRNNLPYLLPPFSHTVCLELGIQGYKTNQFPTFEEFSPRKFLTVTSI